MQNYLDRAQRRIDELARKAEDLASTSEDLAQVIGELRQIAAGHVQQTLPGIGEAAPVSELEEARAELEEARAELRLLRGDVWEAHERRTGDVLLAAWVGRIVRAHGITASERNGTDGTHGTDGTGKPVGATHASPAAGPSPDTGHCAARIGRECLSPKTCMDAVAQMRDERDEARAELRQLRADVWEARHYERLAEMRDALVEIVRAHGITAPAGNGTDGTDGMDGTHGTDGTKPVGATGGSPDFGPVPNATCLPSCVGYPDACPDCADQIASLSDAGKRAKIIELNKLLHDVIVERADLRQVLVRIQRRTERRDKAMRKGDYEVAMWDVRKMAFDALARATAEDAGKDAGAPGGGDAA